MARVGGRSGAIASRQSYWNGVRDGRDGYLSTCTASWPRGLLPEKLLYYFTANAMPVQKRKSSKFTASSFTQSTFVRIDLQGFRLTMEKISFILKCASEKFYQKSIGIYTVLLQLSFIRLIQVCFLVSPSDLEHFKSVLRMGMLVKNHVATSVTNVLFKRTEPF